MSKSKGQGRGTRAARDDAEAGGILSSLGGSIETLIQAAMMYGTTGRSIVILEDVKSGVAALNNVAGGGPPFAAIHTRVSGMIVRMPSDPAAVAIDAPRSPDADRITTFRSGRTIASSVTSSAGIIPES